MLGVRFVASQCTNCKIPTDVGSSHLFHIDATFLSAPVSSGDNVQERNTDQELGSEEELIEMRGELQTRDFQKQEDDQENVRKFLLPRIALVPNIFQCNCSLFMMFCRLSKPMMRKNHRKKMKYLMRMMFQKKICMLKESSSKSKVIIIGLLACSSPCNNTTKLTTPVECMLNMKSHLIC